MNIFFGISPRAQDWARDMRADRTDLAPTSWEGDNLFGLWTVTVHFCNFLLLTEDADFNQE